ncbi:MAG: HAMP domain-containing sensor histidine kinase [Pyrinomonadaceae bacterium]
MRRRKSTIFFLVLGICLVALAVALNIGWIFLNLREVVLLVLGIIFFALIITGLILNMIFLLREIRRNEQQDAFLNSVTHELKTPIASIKLYLETLKTRDITEAKKHEFYDIMLADSNRLLSTVEQVLQASRTREKDRSMHIAEVDAGKLLTETVEIIRSRYNLEKNVISLSIMDENAKVSGDAGELQTVFMNLLDNAVKYSRDLVKIIVKLKITQQNKVEIYIRDNGIGIPPADLKRIFKRFYRVQNASTADMKGTGLGLFIVQSIIKRHGGHIIAKSRGENKGTSFLVQFPKV